MSDKIKTLFDRVVTMKTAKMELPKAFNVEVEHFDHKGLITHINGQRLLKPVPFKCFDLATISVSSTEKKTIVASIEWIEF